MTLASRIAAASKAVGGKLNVDKTNKDAGYDYVSSDAILAYGGQALAEQGIAIVPMLAALEVTPTPYTNNRGEARTRFDALASFIMRISDGETEQEASWFGLGSDYTVPDKAAYKAITSGHKYFIAKLLNIGANNEDGEHETGEEGTATTARRIVGRQPTAASVPNCPKCGGAMWDNRAGKKNQKAPDFKCKDKSCDGAIWPPKDAPQDPITNGSSDPDFDDMPSAAAERPCTLPQRKAIFAIWKSVNGGDEGLRDWLKQHYGTEHTTELTVAQASAIIEALKATEQAQGGAA